MAFAELRGRTDMLSSRVNSESRFQRENALLISSGSTALKRTSLPARISFMSDLHFVVAAIPRAGYPSTKNRHAYPRATHPFVCDLPVESRPFHTNVTRAGG